ncbi:MAG: trypsin-like serine protease [Pseudomonadota bacterium]
MTPLPLLFLALASTAEQRFPAIVNGSVTTEPAGVVALVIEEGGDFYGPFCSATLVQAHWAVTAAHCVTAIRQDYAQYDVYVVTGANLFQSVGQYSRVVDSLANPAYDATLLTDDIGLLELEGAGLPAVQTVPIGTTAVDYSWVGQELRFEGYGITADGAEDMGIKRYADIPLYQFDENLLYGYDPDDGQNVCQGDSGGAALRDPGDGTWELVGVNSFVGLWKGQEGENPCVDGFVGATRLDIELDWIASASGGEIEIDLGGDTGDGDGSLWGGKSGGLCAAAPVGTRGLGLLALAAGAVALRRRSFRTARSPR